MGGGEAPTAWRSRADVGQEDVRQKGVGALEGGGRGTAGQDVLLAIDQASETEAVKGKVPQGIAAVYKAFSQVLLAKVSKGDVQLWAAVRMHCLTGLGNEETARQVAGRSSQAPSAPSSQAGSSQKVDVLSKAAGPVMALVYRNLEVTGLGQEMYDMFAGGAALEALVHRHRNSLKRDAIIGHIACALSFKEYDGEAAPRHLWARLLEFAGIDPDEPNIGARVEQAEDAQGAADIRPGPSARRAPHPCNP